MVPEFFCKEDDWSLYYQLVEEMREQQKKGVNKSEWISWHEGVHLISNNPTGSKTYQMIQEKIAKYFGIEQKSVGTRFNWYRDSSDWKPSHHDSAAFNPSRARTQNITVGVSFGATRELSFLHAQSKTRLYFPQTNGMLFSFGRDVNIQWKHGINALPEEEQDGRGRISIVLWGLVPDVIEEEGSPPLLADNTRGHGHSMHHNQRPHHQNGPPPAAPRDRDANRHQRERDDRDRDRDHRERVSDSRERDRNVLRDRDTNSRGYGGSSGNNLPPPRDVCRDYQRGRCAHGDRCRFDHSDNRDRERGRDRERDAYGHGSERGSRRSEYNDRGRDSSRDRDYDRGDRGRERSRDRDYDSRDRHRR